MVVLSEALGPRRLSYVVLNSHNQIRLGIMMIEIRGLGIENLGLGLGTEIGN